MDSKDYHHTRGVTQTGPPIPPSQASLDDLGQMLSRNRDEHARFVEELKKRIDRAAKEGQHAMELLERYGAGMHTERQNG